MATETVKLQTNIEYEAKDITAMRHLAIQFDSSLAGMFQVAIKHFLRTPRKELSKLCKTAPKKVMGRKL
jgi:hypothetical protein